MKDQGAVERKRDDKSLASLFMLNLQRLKTHEYWRNMIVHFCLCSLVGHWLEIPWVHFSRWVLGVYDPNSLIWQDAFYPFLVYGVGAFVCSILLVPFLEYCTCHSRNRAIGILKFFLFCVFVCMLMELGMGLLFNQPDAAGNYPIWVNAGLPLNILNQAWLPNDLLLGACASIFTAVVYPFFERLMKKPSSKTMDFIAVIVLLIFVVLCVLEFSAII